MEGTFWIACTVRTDKVDYDFWYSAIAANLELHAEEIWWTYSKKHAEVEMNSVLHVECGLNLGVGILYFLFLAVEIVGRLKPCGLSDHNYCIKVGGEEVAFERIMSIGFTSVARLS